MDPMGSVIVSSTAEIGKFMRMQTIAEFVEDEEILHRVEEIGIDFAQGHFIGRPEPLSNRKANI